MALEELYFGQNVQTAFAVGHARGVVMLAAGERAVPCASYTPQQVKAAVCGNGRARKEQVARMVQTLLGLPEQPTPDHASDALAVAICHVNARRCARAAAEAGAAMIALLRGRGRGAPRRPRGDRLRGGSATVRRCRRRRCATYRRWAARPRCTPT